MNSRLSASLFGIVYRARDLGVQPDSGSQPGSRLFLVFFCFVFVPFSWQVLLLIVAFSYLFFCGKPHKLLLYEGLRLPCICGYSGHHSLVQISFCHGPRGVIERRNFNFDFFLCLF